MAASASLLVDDDHDTCASMSDIISTWATGWMWLTTVRRPWRCLGESRMGWLYSITSCPEWMVWKSTAIKEVQADTVGILVTGFADDDIVVAAFRAGMRRVLPKPVSFCHLRPLIKEVVGGL
jgi:DNA-binding NtrC family response regulator